MGLFVIPILNEMVKKRGKFQYRMTMFTKAHDYMKYLFDIVFADYSRNTGLKPYANLNLPQHEGTQVTQYHFSTKSLPIFIE